MNRTAAACLALAGILFASTALAGACPPTGMSRQQLVDLQAHEFAVADNARRLHWISFPAWAARNPTLRDKIAFEALAAWMRGKQLSATTVGAIRDRLLPQLAPDFPDPTGFQQPFAVLVLAEVVRVDRVEPFMTDQQLQQLVDASTRYLQSVRDYRGFDEREGWRHGVARVAQVVREVAAPAPLAKWADAWTSQRGLAKHHNTMAFLSALYVYVHESGAEFQELVLPPLVEAIKQLQ